MSDEKVHQTSGDHVAKRLLDKSKEAFALAVELYNRPTLRYHAEACSIFLCNAWELMLKAHLIEEEGLEAIYYPRQSRSNNLARRLPQKDFLQRQITAAGEHARAHQVSKYEHSFHY